MYIYIYIYIYIYAMRPSAVLASSTTRAKPRARERSRDFSGTPRTCHLAKRQMNKNYPPMSLSKTCAFTKSKKVFTCLWHVFPQ